MKIENPNLKTGALGALLDEYARAINELIECIEPLTDQQLVKVVDFLTKNEDCRSVQTILAHVVQAGYAYVFYIRRHRGETLLKRATLQKSSVREYIVELKNMFQYNLDFFESNTKIPLEEHDDRKKIAVDWGQFYDVEQLMEHAIVHILRHRRQIENFKKKLNW